MYLFLKTSKYKDLNKKYYKKNKIEFIKFEEKKINTIRIQKCILIVFFLTIISPFLYLYKKTRKNSINKRKNKFINFPNDIHNL
jgi:cbb3-type cytochrome oxidase subunit 3